MAFSVHKKQVVVISSKLTCNMDPRILLNNSCIMSQLCLIVLEHRKTANLI